jgi:hypothetical protein
MFLPMRLRDYVRELRVDDGHGGTRPLVKNERMLLPTIAHPEASAPPHWMPTFVVLGLAIAALFAVANVARYLKVNAEVALRRTVGKFYRRFGYIEEVATRQGKKLTDMTLDEMDLLWQASKADE